MAMCQEHGIQGSRLLAQHLVMSLSGAEKKTGVGHDFLVGGFNPFEKY